tara:strand:- start:454 stop:2013 length:1560 start_codon:yes stop_codon:yes gene_type:complete
MAKICIVGGGSSGWMTAAAFCHLFPEHKIQLVESYHKPKMSVGESTLGHFNRYLNLLGLEDKEWMAACNATYKVSIQFTNWKGDGTTFQYPFGETDYSDGGIVDWYHLHNLYPDEFPDNTFCEFYNPITYLAQTNRVYGSGDYIRNFSPKWNRAYHFDSDKFGNWLKDNRCQSVEHSWADIEKGVFNSDGEIDYLVDSQGMMYHADYFIDCTGFRSALLGGIMGVPYQNFEFLPNDRAIAARIPYENRREQMINTTDGYAMPEGWVWTIPLWNRIGKGYVYSSKFTTEEDAEETFREHLGGFEGDLQHIKFRHGRRMDAWVKNVIGIGLSQGFLEPLESTGLFSTHENIIRLIDVFQRRDGFISKLDVDGYNHSVNYEMEAMKEFIEIHYYLSPRTDTPYWRQFHERSPLTHEEMNDKIVRSPRLYQELIHSFNISNAPQALGGTTYIAAGLGYHPCTKATTEYVINRDEYSNAEARHSADRYKHYKESVLRYLKTQPVHYDYLLKNIYDNDESFEFIS